TADRNRSHWSTSKTPSYTKSVSWQHHQRGNDAVYRKFQAVKYHCKHPGKSGPETGPKYY
ncbi:hypothetical protein, partial [Escherichia coli]